MAKYDLGCPIVSWLDVGVEFLVAETAWPEVNDLDAGFVAGFQKDVLGFYVAVDYPVFVEEEKCGEHLDRDASDQLAR